MIIFKSLLVKSLSVMALTVAVSALPEVSVINQASAQEQKASERKTRRTPALRSKVYEQLSRAQERADAGDSAKAIKILDEVKDKSSSMNSYEKAMMFNFYAFIYYNDENFDQAIASFEQAIAQQPIPVAFEQTTLFSLAQLYLMRGDAPKTIEYLERWEALNDGKIPVKNYVLKAQAAYQGKLYEDASKYISVAIDNHEAEGMLPDENWLILQRAIFYEMKQPEKVKDIIAKLIRLYDAPKYWIQLAGMYGELGEEKEQLATLEAAYQMGYVTSATDVFNLAQLYYYHQAPYKAARLMEQALDKGLLEQNLRNLKFLAQCWSYARENDKAVPVMQAAAHLSEDGELDAQLGQTYLKMDRFDEAIAASQVALEKGGLRNQGTTHLVLGMALFNTRQFVAALNELAEAEKFQSSKGMARQWSKFVETEKASFERMQVRLAMTSSDHSAP